MASTARAVVRSAGTSVDRVLPPPSGITVLIYHRVGGGTRSSVDLDVEAFTEQIDALASHCRIVSLDDAVAELLGATVSTEPGVVLTFDDGTTDFTETVVPLVAQRGLPVTLYAATRFIDTGDDFPWGAPPTSWSALADAMSTGLVTVASHTHSHPVLHRSDAATTAHELETSIRLIGDRLGTPARHFAYPRAVVPSAAAEVEVRRHFVSAALAGSRPNVVGQADLLRLARTPVQRDDGLDDVLRLARGGGRLLGGVRAGVLAARHRRVR